MPDYQQALGESEPMEPTDGLTPSNEVEQVLTALRTLQERTSIPVVRACLEEVCLEIAHLTSWQGALAEGETEQGDQGLDLIHQ